MACLGLCVLSRLEDETGEFSKGDWFLEFGLFFAHLSSFLKRCISEGFSVLNPYKAGVFGYALLHLAELHCVAAYCVGDSGIVGHKLGAEGRVCTSDLIVRTICSLSQCKGLRTHPQYLCLSYFGKIENARLLVAQEAEQMGSRNPKSILLGGDIAKINRL